MRNAKYLFFLLVSVIISYSFLVDSLVVNFIKTSGLVFFIRMVIALLLVPFSIFLINRIRTLLSLCTINQKILVGIFTLLLAGLLQFLMPISQNYWIEITATGVKDSHALGSEVWLHGVNVDGKRQNNNDFLYDANAWEIRGDSFVSYKNQPSSIKWRNYADNKIELALTEHPYSGEVQVNVNGDVVTYNLYATNSQAKHIDINVAEGKWQLTSTWIKLIGNIVCALLVVLIAMLTLLKKSADVPSHSAVDKLFWKRIYLLPLIIWIVYYLAFYPGIMSPDSVDQWKQIMGEYPLTSAHPVFHTIFNWLVTRVWQSPAAIALVQMCFMAGVVGYGLKTLSEYGIKKRYLVVIIVFFSVMPIFGILANTLWKDVPYSVAVLWLTILLTKIYATEGEFISNKYNQALVSFVLFIIFQIRHEGIFIVIAVVMCLLKFYPSWRKKAIYITVGCLLFFGIFKVAATVTFHPQQPPMRFQSTQIVVQPMSHIAAGLKEGWEPSVEDKRIIEGVMPINAWVESYNKYNVEKIVYNPSINDYFLKANQINLLKVWLHLLIEKPNILLQAWSNLTSVCWQIKQPVDGYQSVTLGEADYPFFYKEVFGAESEYSFLPRLKSKIIKFYTISNNPSYSWFLWRPALYFYLSWFMFMGLLFNRKWKAVLPLIPITIQVVVMMIVIPVQDVRYLFSVFLISPFLIMFGACLNQDNEK